MDKCLRCKTELATGFGLAGGGYGAYTYCPNVACEEPFFDKTQELDERSPQESE